MSVAAYNDETLVPYHVATEHARSYDWFYVRVFYGDLLIAQKTCVKNHTRAAKWAAEQIRKHEWARKKISSLRIFEPVPDDPDEGAIYQ